MFVENKLSKARVNPRIKFDFPFIITYKTIDQRDCKSRAFHFDPVKDVFKCHRYFKNPNYRKKKQFYKKKVVYVYYSEASIIDFHHNQYYPDILTEYLSFKEAYQNYIQLFRWNNFKHKKRQSVANKISIYPPEVMERYTKIRRFLVFESASKEEEGEEDNQPKIQFKPIESLFDEIDAIVARNEIAALYKSQREYDYQHCIHC